MMLSVLVCTCQVIVLSVMTSHSTQACPTPAPFCPAYDLFIDFTVVTINRSGGKDLVEGLSRLFTKHKLWQNNEYVGLGLALGRRRQDYDTNHLLFFTSLFCLLLCFVDPI